MKMKTTKTSMYEDVEVQFDYERDQLLWKGDYLVSETIDEHGNSTSSITIERTEFIETWSDEKEDWIKINPIPALLAELINKLETIHE